jgi:hypothetical protein
VKTAKKHGPLTIGCWTVQLSVDADKPDCWDLIDEGGDLHESGDRLKMIGEAHRLNRRDEINSLRKMIRDEIDSLEDDDTPAVLDRLVRVQTILKAGYSDLYFQQFRSLAL